MIFYGFSLRELEFVTSGFQDQALLISTFLDRVDGVKHKNYTPGVKIAIYPIDFTLKTKNHGVFFFYPIETFFLWGKILKF